MLQPISFLPNPSPSRQTEIIILTAADRRKDLIGNRMGVAMVCG